MVVTITLAVIVTNQMCYWSVLNIYKTIVINIYVLVFIYIHLIAWVFICEPGFQRGF